MRRGIGFTLICLGLFLAVLGGAIRYWAYDRLVVVPIDLYSTLDLPGRATYLDLTAVREKTADVVLRQTVRADVSESTDRVLVVDLSQVISTADGQFIRASVEHAAIDRRSGAAVNCCDESVDETPAEHSGYLFKFPFGTPQRDLTLWDGTSSTANPARYAGTDTVAGHTVYRFVTHSPARQIRTQTDTGALVGEPRTFDAPVWNESTRTYWVEPVTGTPLALQVTTRTTLRNSRNQDRATVFAGTLRSAHPDAQTLALVTDGKRRIELVQRWPLRAIGAGGVLAALGVALLLWRRPRPRHRAAARTPAPVSPAPPRSTSRALPIGQRAPERWSGGSARHATDEIPVADRPLSRYVRPYLDGETERPTGRHRAPEEPLRPPPRSSPRPPS
ncbi:DUF3068 domain-containing protein [Cryptosporangium phraense]|uniref:DUF3068 domain-containing protein n=1 Tax=Cryptosporangium phraense TaxID=2593070 RepID=A0A545APE8_9ACTN|nr:DUF3068 domain-containing protein [Cryptosporangium phraense]TQS43198.1 DUF3068 domain-containing protein [Cryptosporangium phraense]